MMEDGRPGQGRPAGPPDSLTELVRALTRLGRLGPVERARVIPDLRRATATILNRVRAEALLEATTGPDRLSQSEVARRVGLGRVKVAEAIRTVRERSDD